MYKFFRSHRIRGSGSAIQAAHSARRPALPRKTAATAILTVLLAGSSVRALAMWTVKELPSLLPGYPATATAISPNSAMVVGVSKGPAGLYAVRWDLENLPVTIIPGATPKGITDDGKIALLGRDYVDFYSPVGGLRRVVDGTDLSVAMNSDGTMVVSGNENGQPFGFLWTEVSGRVDFEAGFKPLAINDVLDVAGTFEGKAAVKLNGKPVAVV